MTFLQQLECNTGDTNVSLILSEWVNEYTFYAFRIIDGLIRPGTYVSQSKFSRESAGLKMSFVSTVNKHIKMILLYQMLERIKFDRVNAVLVL